MNQHKKMKVVKGSYDSIDRAQLPDVLFFIGFDLKP
jgi:hypothetical protein